MTAKLAEFERACADLEDYKAKAARAAIDEDRALEDAELTENEAAERIQTAQMQKGVYKARQAQREKAIATLSIDLYKATTEGENELRGLVSAEVSRRESVISERVVAARQVGNAVDPRRMTNELAEILRFSGPVQLAEALGPSPVIPTPGNSEVSIHAAREVLTKFQKAISETGKRYERLQGRSEGCI